MFIFYVLAVGLPCRSIFCQFWLCEEAQCVYLRRRLGSPEIFFITSTLPQHCLGTKDKGLSRLTVFTWYVRCFSLCEPIILQLMLTILTSTLLCGNLRQITDVS